MKEPVQLLNLIKLSMTKPNPCFCWPPLSSAFNGCSSFLKHSNSEPGLGNPVFYILIKKIKSAAGLQ